MAFRKTKIIGFVMTPDGVPVVNTTLKFTPDKPFGYTNTHLVLNEPVTVTTMEGGAFVAELWADGDSLIPIDYNVLVTAVANRTGKVSVFYSASDQLIGNLLFASATPDELVSASSLTSLLNASAVRFDVAQTLTNEQKTQARTNIGVTESGGGGGTSDHSELTNLDADDHVQYFNQTRGDVRYERTANKNQASGYAGLNSGGKIFPSLLPDTDSLTEGSNNKFFTAIRAYAAQIGSLSIVASAVSLGDSLGVIIGKLQGQINSLFSSLSGKADKSTRRTVTGTSDTVDGTDNGNFIDYTNNSEITLTVPVDLQNGFASDEVFAVGFTALGNGAILFSPASGVTITNANGHTKIQASGNGALRSIGANIYLLLGDTE